MKVSILTILMAFLLAAGIPFSALAGIAVDTDGDTVADVSDNCMTLFQAAGQFCDDDQDGYGNMCDGDLDNGGATGAADFPLFTAAWGTGPDAADFDCGGAVGAADFPLFTGMWGAAPGPSGLSCAGTIPCP